MATGSWDKLTFTFKGFPTNRAFKWGLLRMNFQMKSQMTFALEGFATGPAFMLGFL